LKEPEVLNPNIMPYVLIIKLTVMYGGRLALVGLPYCTVATGCSSRTIYAMHVVFAMPVGAAKP
jgi:hypothetical protein